MRAPSTVTPTGAGGHTDGPRQRDSVQGAVSPDLRHRCSVSVSVDLSSPDLDTPPSTSLPLPGLRSTTPRVERSQSPLRDLLYLYRGLLPFSPVSPCLTSGYVEGPQTTPPATRMDGSARYSRRSRTTFALRSHPDGAGGDLTPRRRTLSDGWSTPPLPDSVDRRPRTGRWDVGPSRSYLVGSRRSGTVRVGYRVPRSLNSRLGTRSRGSPFSCLNPLSHTSPTPGPSRLPVDLDRDRFVEVVSSQVD